MNVSLGQTGKVLTLIDSIHDTAQLSEAAQHRYQLDKAMAQADAKMWDTSLDTLESALRSAPHGALHQALPRVIVPKVGRASTARLRHRVQTSPLCPASLSWTWTCPPHRPWPSRTPGPPHTPSTPLSQRRTAPTERSSPPPRPSGGSARWSGPWTSHPDGSLPSMQCGGVQVGDVRAGAGRSSGADSELVPTDFDELSPPCAGGVGAVEPGGGGAMEAGARVRPRPLWSGSGREVTGRIGCLAFPETIESAAIAKPPHSPQTAAGSPCELRKADGLTQEEAAKVFGVTRVAGVPPGDAAGGRAARVHRAGRPGPR